MELALEKMNKSAKRILILVGSCLIAGYARPLSPISGPFGTINPPNEKEYAEIELRTGELISAKHLEEEHDTIFAILLDYRYKPIPSSAIARITIKDTPETIMENRNRNGILFLILIVTSIVVGAVIINEKNI